MDQHIEPVFAGGVKEKTDHLAQAQAAVHRIHGDGLEMQALGTGGNMAVHLLREHFQDLRTTLLLPDPAVADAFAVVEHKGIGQGEGGNFLFDKIGFDLLGLQAGASQQETDRQEQGQSFHIHSFINCHRL